MSKNNHLSGSDEAYSLLGRLLEPHGLMARCALHLSEDADLAAREHGYLTIVLAGHVGSSFWPMFERYQQEHEGPDPLDAWSRTVGEAIAPLMGCVALYPFEEPWWPFQSWISRAEGLKPSPLGILIHPQFGLWHGYRMAFAFREPISIPAPTWHPHTCDDCIDKPCIGACPVQAITGQGFLRDDCRRHLRGAAGQAECMQQGCLARSACPVGAHYRYNREQLRFHMEALDMS